MSAIEMGLKLQDAPEWLFQWWNWRSTMEFYGILRYPMFRQPEVVTFDWIANVCTGVMQPLGLYGSQNRLLMLHGIQLNKNNKNSV